MPGEAKKCDLNYHVALFSKLLVALLWQHHYLVALV
jgi:hypothetical protein